MHDRRLQGHSSFGDLGACLRNVPEIMQLCSTWLVRIAAWQSCVLGVRALHAGSWLHTPIDPSVNPNPSILR
jgi:hypothetical protein